MKPFLISIIFNFYISDSSAFFPENETKIIVKNNQTQEEFLPEKKPDFTKITQKLKVFSNLQCQRSSICFDIDLTEVAKFTNNLERDLRIGTCSLQMIRHKIEIDDNKGVRICIAIDLQSIEASLIKPDRTIV